ncbi:hypothetical protein EW093_01125 [Thiospirochaeta perfilievii]|uniref:Uncharacterized protein n=1 Tax=Thiospirochaeta perfilievii TaxID=252967 RepID=A0A5C1Q5N0_9SPIO|nr:hypothetical protein [Thiospirochaeta perfilievii]QEN03363.1 hypothetical protein EW093_01125 [Thiospirochaeta perfilievii]
MKILNCKMLIVSLLIFISFSCSNVEFIQMDNTKKNSTISSISTRVDELNNLGLFDDITTGLSRSLDSNILNIDTNNVHYFINNTEESLGLLLDEENGESKLELVNLMLNEGTVGEVISVMEKIDPALASDYENSLAEFLEDAEISTGRGLENSNIGSIYDIKLRTTPYGASSRGALAKDLSWNTIQWYIGLSATTIAGLSAYKWVKWYAPWVGVAGLITAGVGTTYMCAQLVIWYSNTPELGKFVSSVQAQGTGGNPATILSNTGISDFGKKMATIIGTTAGVAGFTVVFTPELISTIARGLVNSCNALYYYLFNWLPAGVVPTINGFRLVPIPYL